MSVSYFNTNEYELMNKDNIVATVSCTRDEFNDLYFEIHHIFSQLPIGFKTFKDWIENRRAPSNRQHIEKLLKRCNCYDLEGFLQVTHAATLNDTFRETAYSQKCGRIIPKRQNGRLQRR